MILNSGLSPRVRGNRLEGLKRMLKRRSIPACAGEPEQIDQGVDYLGLSPRVRGNLF